MIARVWHGWTSPANAPAYEALLRTKVMPGHLGEIAGYAGAQVLRREEGGEVEFAVTTYFHSLDAVRAFAGSDPEKAVILPEARRLLARFEERTRLYTVAIGPDQIASR
jgi:heme-degrading monooxygenase HmoA